MGALIDSSVLIASERGDLDLEVKLGEYTETDLAVAAITASELLHGVHRTDDEARRSRREAWVEGLLSRMPVIAFDLLAARAHARLAAGSRSQGLTIGAHDLLIAATALARGLEIVTRDERSFPRIPDLAVVLW